MRKVTLSCLALSLSLAGLAQALVNESSSAGPSALVFSRSGIDTSPSLSGISALPAAYRWEHDAVLARLGVTRDSGVLELESGRWAALRPAEPLLPGSGVGNQLSWTGLGLVPPRDDSGWDEAARSQMRAYLGRHSADLGIEWSEIDAAVGVFDQGGLVQLTADRRVSGLAVRGARFTAVINHGNLVLLGTRRWADIDLELVPSLSRETALAAASEFLRPWRVDRPLQEPQLAVLPLRKVGQHDFGLGYEHRLVWTLVTAVSESDGRWETLVDAHSGEVLAFQDLTHYGTARNINGGVYPASNDGLPPDGTMVSGYPMPYSEVDLGGFADSGGNFSAVGLATTTLDGQFVTITDGCGAIVESDTEDIELEGAHGDTDCDVPPGHSAGDTAGARTAYYELNRIIEGAKGVLPANAWLAGQLEANVNINSSCGAFWNGTSVNFYRNNGGPCANTAEMAAVIGHEWGHGLDDNDLDGSIPSVPQGGGEGPADLFAALRGDVSCIGRGFFTAGTLCGGYGDPCTAASGCTGVRTVDYADRQSGLPHTLTWARSFCINDGGGHCRGAAYSETVWDLLKRDLPAVYGMDNNTAMEVTLRLFLIGGGNASGLFDFSGPAPGDAGCAAGQAYLQFLAADDDDGDINNGTPHMTAIAAAFDRLEIGCTPGGGTPGPTVQDSGCSPTPTAAPVVSALATDQGADLSWAAVPDAAEYQIYRTDGEKQCDLGKTLVGTTAGLTFSDSGLQNERPYYYVVLPMGAGGDSCFGPASSCAEVGATLIFDDGFESGDTSAWSQTVP